MMLFGRRDVLVSQSVMNALIPSPDIRVILQQQLHVSELPVFPHQTNKRVTTRERTMRTRRNAARVCAIASFLEVGEEEPVLVADKTAKAAAASDFRWCLCCGCRSPFDHTIQSNRHKRSFHVL